MSSKLRKAKSPSFRSHASGGQQRIRNQAASSQNKKIALQPISPKTNEIDDETQPISDFPSPPVQIVSCRHGMSGVMVQLPSLASAAKGEIPQLAFKKLKQCCHICDFSEADRDVSYKATKKATLNELIDCYSNPKTFSRLTRECHQQLIEMFSVNVFRPPPSIPREILVSDEVTIEDTAWPHLQLVYILFLKFLDCSVDPRILQYQLSPKFISNIFAVLDFPDERERGQAKAVISSIFNKVPPQRQLLFNVTVNLLLSVPDGFELNAASNLLELFYLFTEGSPPPLTPAMVTAFNKVLLPLHLPSRCQRYFPPLVKCILLMIRKDARLGNNLLSFLISHWPLTLDHKAELFLDEILQMIRETVPKFISSNIKGLFTCVSIAAESPSMNLAGKALNFLLDNKIKNFIVEQPHLLLGIVFPALFRVARGHWHRNVQVTALNVMNTLMELDPESFKQVALEFKMSSLNEKYTKQMKLKLWKSVVKVASKNDDSFDPKAVKAEISNFYTGKFV
ncbi:serine/threonine-protein phosphatase 2A 56 kDa regulatory subunit epsilon isoform [Histomonas meleagridis]|uniref:serine/threonine-protein phosphatase 2A 56 kDa regulatory subunit epsilon isoform n=1 Tax=Histomonas meleagridis TaxID=135588 RepID=UPI0035599187|nr:serine/threonine-protein phosphatase 2A 56 kDa regulatory subunit epsilon isoform [Histomonas meleagridis]KAH0799185.1 serine/threonine-protein phosphatase 2A 56 kDa regulatory subunit epsilon isoform [Histomonas meleagridis]